MSDDDRLKDLLRSSLPVSSAFSPSRDLWPSVLACRERPISWSWVDIAIGVVVATALLMSPDWLWLLAYHL